MTSDVKSLRHELYSLKQKEKLLDAKIKSSAAHLLPTLKKDLTRQRESISIRIAQVNDLLVHLIGEETEINPNELIRKIEEIKNEMTLTGSRVSKAGEIMKLADVLRIKLFNIGMKANSLDPIKRSQIKELVATTSSALAEWKERRSKGIAEQKEKARQQHHEKQSQKKIKQEKVKNYSSKLKLNGNLKLSGQPQKAESNSIHNIRWSDIQFNDGFLRIYFNNKYYKVDYIRSRRSFNLLKKWLDIFIENSVNITFNPSTNAININDNLQIIDRIFDRLEIEQSLTNININNPNYFFKTFLSQWTNQQLLQACTPEKRTPYLECLCKIYSDNYKIIPVREKRKNDSSNSITEEDAFLFPIEGKKYVYILWESVEEKRATYVFRCLSDQYPKAVQNIFDYVISNEITNKRDRLRQGNVGYFRNSIVEYCHSLNHNDLEEWKGRLAEVCF